MGSIKTILIGWGKRFGLIQTSDAEKKLSELRMTFCKKCPLSKISKVLTLIEGNAKYENIIACTKCGCPCKQKTLVVSESCPIYSW